MQQEITWGVVQSLGPTTVRLSGDIDDIAVAVKNDDVTLTVTDKVLLAKAGPTDGWVIVCVVGATS